jgi:hypothetical protein
MKNPRDTRYTKDWAKKKKRFLTCLRFSRFFAPTLGPTKFCFFFDWLVGLVGWMGGWLAGRWDDTFDDTFRFLVSTTGS